jgi:HlyD family secretion protein
MFKHNWNAFKKTTWGFVVLTALLVVGLLSGCSALGGADETAEPETAAPVVAVSDQITVEGRIVPAADAWLSFLQPGTVAEVLVAEGQVVEAGQALARLGDTERLQAAVTAAELEVLAAQQILDDLNRTADLVGRQSLQARVTAERQLLEAQQRLEDLDTPEYREEMDDAWETVQDELDNLEDAQDEFDRVKDLSENNTTRQQAEDDLEEAQKAYNDAQRTYERLANDLEQARADVGAAQAALDEAQRQYDERKDGPDPQDLALVQERLRAAEANLAASQATLAQTTLSAPFAGTLTRVDLVAGEAVTAFKPVIQLADLTAWFVETTDLNEIDVAAINTTQPAVVFPDALPDMELRGIVERVADGFEERSGDVLYTVRLSLEGDTDGLRWGMTTSVEFERK